ncbi:hypothetical protein [Puniceicoccus vermicola]|uniref:Uncharacterized protein n=1 Tax=Puniceicoccus vermicola TaxID=388746 RepID=A0A7X1B1U4_9BACT|nr:hypothetical protein [Puniceicoccus vermicola]MBC2604002.1 hypothetical protein [Puniceicoccus vermicola]
MSYGDPHTELQQKQILKELKTSSGDTFDGDQSGMSERQWLEEEKQSLGDWRMRLCLPLVGFGLFVQIIGFETVRRVQENSEGSSRGFLNSFSFSSIFCIGFGLCLFAVAAVIFAKNSKRIRKLQERLEALG